ncbi:MAG TPA: hypothetical protein VIF15_00210, partial [Polyangiaceae bacterium]
MASPLERPLAARRLRASFRRLGLKLAGLALLVVLLVVGVSRIDVAHDLHAMRVRVLSGESDGNYHALVARFARAAAAQHGIIENQPTAGSAENVLRLGGAARSCEVQFALAQAGSDWGPGLQLLGRLAKPEAILFLGRNADGMTELGDLEGMRIGIGPAGSGTDRLMRQIFALPELAALHAVLSNHPGQEELQLAELGDLDLAVLVIDQDAPLVSEWVLRHGLGMAGFFHAESVARRLPHLGVGRIAAGDYDAVKDIPRLDKKVITVETVLVGNGCASRVATIDLLGVVSSQLPDFVRHNRETPNTTGLALSPVAADYFANEGPQLADIYLPWLVDVMPPANWAYVVMGVSLLFNAMGFGHRFRLWRIDAARVKLEGELG